MGGEGEGWLDKREGERVEESARSHTYLLELSAVRK